MTIDSRYGGGPIYEDRKLPCADCGCWFECPAGEQRYFDSKGWKLPRRCPDCRKRNRALRAGDPGKRHPTMGTQEDGL